MNSATLKEMGPILKSADSCTNVVNYQLSSVKKLIFRIVRLLEPDELCKPTTWNCVPKKNQFFLVDFFRKFRFQIRTPREKSMRFDVLHDQIGSILGYF